MKSDGPEETSGDTPLERYLRVLEFVSGLSDGATANEIATHLNLPKPTVHRLVRALAASGALKLSEETPLKYVLGRRVLDLLHAGATASWLSSMSKPVLEKLAAQSGAAWFVAELKDGKIQSICFAAPNTEVQAYVIPGAPVVPHAGASGKAILAHLSPAERKSLLGARLTRLTDATIVDKAALDRHLEEVRRRNLAICDEEDLEGFAAIASALVTDNFPVKFAICVTGTRRRILGDARQELEAMAQSGASSLSAMLETRLRGELNPESVLQ